MFITNDPNFAKAIYDSGVSRIFIDLEVNGKQKRQGHLDSVKSKHSFEDVIAIRKVVPEAELLVRLNPFYEGTHKEVDRAIHAGADLIMLPMFRTLKEVEALSEMVDGRAGIIPLFETPESLDLVQAISRLRGVSEVYVGLNDLHLALHMDFMFEPLTKGLVEQVAKAAKQVGIPFGFGGIARIDEGDVTGSMVLGEHLRLKSDSVILSRTFYRQEEGVDDAKNIFLSEIKRLRDEEARLAKRTGKQVEIDHERFCQAVDSIVKTKIQKSYDKAIF